MKELPSTEFRKTFARLTEPTTVTVLGRPIGTYQPISTSIDARAVEAIRPGEPPIPTLAEGDLVVAKNQLPEGLPDGVYRLGGSFNSRPFTPVPKKGK